MSSIYTVYPKKYAHGFCFAVLCCGYTLIDFPISIRLTSLALWQSNDCPSASKATLINMDKYFMWIHYERLHNHNKAKHNKTVCIFLGIYCSESVSQQTAPDVYPWYPCIKTHCLSESMCHVFVLQDLVVEVAYPRCAICRLQDGLVSANKSTMSLLHSGQTDREYVGMFIAGSQAEGLALEVIWGHPLADIDIMWLYGGRLGVYIPEAPSPRGSASLEYHPDGCPPAYCNLEVTDPTALREAIRYHKKSWWKGYIQSRRCTPCVDGRQWLNTYHTVRLMTSKTVIGPAGQSTRRIEDITTLVCSGPHPALQREFRHRSRKQWPTSHVIEYILKLPMLLVLVGHKFSKNFKREARISWSHCETKIMQELSESVRQGYIACKYVLKYFLAVHRGQTKSGDGRSRVGSFHIKTVFLHYLEKRPPHMIKSTFGLFVDLLHNLDHHLGSGELPHYFLSECNLLETVGGEERRIARQAIQAILSDPLAALLTSPTRPQQIYGELRPDALVHNFRRVITHPMCQQNWKDLSVLLARIDECSHKFYCEQRRMDES